jgi:glycosyltransferase involved in cell wall biosynthesis
MIKEYLSIVIPCKNEEFYILKTLESIQQQNFSNELQIIIADAQSTDKTRELINQFKQRRTSFIRSKCWCKISNNRLDFIYGC